MKTQVSISLELTVDEAKSLATILGEATRDHALEITVRHHNFAKELKKSICDALTDASMEIAP